MTSTRREFIRYTGLGALTVALSSLFNHTSHVRPGMPNQTPEGYDRGKALE